MKDKIYKKQVGGDHYKSMVIQPSEFINRNNIFISWTGIYFISSSTSSRFSVDARDFLNYYLSSTCCQLVD